MHLVTTKVAVNDIQAARAHDHGYYERMIRQPLEMQLQSLGWIPGDSYSLFKYQDMHTRETVYRAEAFVADAPETAQQIEQPAIEQGKKAIEP